MRTPTLEVLLPILILGWTPSLDGQEAEPTAEVIALAARVAHQDGKALSPEELTKLKERVGKLGYDDVLEAINSLELPDGAALVARTITPGEPLEDPKENWEAPARILADRLVEIAPRHTSRWIQREGMGWRGSVAFIDRFAKSLPKVAWEETKRHYAEYWERFDGGKDYPIPALANGIFCALEEVDGSPGREFILDGSYAKEPYSSQLQRDALMGMLRAADSAEEFVAFLNWRLGPAKNLSDEMTGHSFRVDTGPTWRITALALALLAKDNPEKAIDWATENKARLDFDWHYQIYAGWVEFWPEKREEIPGYESRREDAFHWLAELVEVDSSAIHNAYFHWRAENYNESQEWLQGPADSKKLKAVKELLKAKEKQTRPTSR